ncbi:DUF177 domain-containing protein [Candidatus Eisenbacteria bacterium]|uniref:DUF177 domain-containing protein n=1 Tax=Eiseniibacteriota bacterium TaxID=2212470 RepID=A0ABV6YPM8_UNCEI
MIKLDIGRVPDGHSHLDIEAEGSDLEACLEDGRLESPVNLRLDLDRRGDDIFIKGMVEARAVLGCSRCLIEYSLELEAPLELWCMVSGESDAAGEEDRENVVRISPGAKFMDLAGPARSELLLLLPLKPLCDEGCKGLCPGCGIDLNASSCSCGPEGHDSRWDALNKIK